MADVLITDPTLTVFHEKRTPEAAREMVYYETELDPETNDVRMKIRHRPAIFIEFDYCLSDNEGRANALKERKDDENGKEEKK